MTIYNSSNELFTVNLKGLIHSPEFKCKPRNLFIHENLGFSARITDPRDRLITLPERKWDLFYALGEFLWYVSGSNDLAMISHYAPSYSKFSDDGKTLYGAYGARMFGFPQHSDKHHSDAPYHSVVRKLKSDADSRQAVLLLWQPEDMNIKHTKDLPCTVYLQFFLRDDKLDLITNMRSNDIWLGTTNDVFCFTMLQEMLAYELDVKLGFYQHNAGSLHVYQNVIEKLSDVSTPTKTVPMLPIPELYREVWELIAYEKTFRQTKDSDCFYSPDDLESIVYTSKEVKELMWVLYCGNLRKRHGPNDQKCFEIGLLKIKQEAFRKNLLSKDAQ